MSGRVEFGSGRNVWTLARLEARDAAARDAEARNAAARNALAPGELAAIQARIAASEALLKRDVEAERKEEPSPVAALDAAILASEASRARLREEVDKAREAYHKSRVPERSPGLFTTVVRPMGAAFCSVIMWMLSRSSRDSSSAKEPAAGVSGAALALPEPSSAPAAAVPRASAGEGARVSAPLALVGVPAASPAPKGVADPS